MANSIAVIKVPQDVSIPSAGISGPDWLDTVVAKILSRGRTFDVKDYGATGNGTTDDTAAIQAAVNAIPSAGGRGGATLVFPYGEYRVSSTITIAKHGVRIDSAGGFTAMIVPTAGMTGPVFDFAITNSIFRGPQVKNIRLYMHGGSANGIRFASAYDNGMMENVFIDGLGGTSYGVRFETQTGASSPVSQTFVAINCWVNGRTGYTGNLWDITNLQEATFINCKGVGPVANTAAAAFRIRGGRSLAFYNCSASSAVNGFDIGASSSAKSNNITLDQPLFEGAQNALVIVGTAANPASAIVMRNPRVQTLAGPSTVNYAAGCDLEIGGMSITLGANAEFNTVRTSNRANVTDNGTYTTIYENRNALNGRQGMSPGLNLFAPSGPQLRFEVAGRTDYHLQFWNANSGGDAGFTHRYYNGSANVNMHTIFANGLTQSWYVWNGSAQVETLKIDRLPTPGKTAVYIATNRAGTVALQQVEVGAADSAGAGFRTLRVPN